MRCGYVEKIRYHGGGKGTRGIGNGPVTIVKSYSLHVPIRVSVTVGKEEWG